LKSQLMFTVVIFLVLASIAPAATMGFVSDTSWAVNDGFAQAVCLNSSAPAICPAGATMYGFAGAGWGTNLAAIPGAAWIFGPGVAGATTPAELASFTFTKSFFLNGAPTGGSILISADDFGSVSVNGSQVGTVGSTTNIALAGQKANLATFDLSEFLNPGLNTIAVTVQNGLFGGCTNCTFAQNPAGAVFGGTLSFNGAEVPEPGTISLLAAGISLLALGRYRFAKR